MRVWLVLLVGCGFHGPAASPGDGGGDDAARALDAAAPDPDARLDAPASTLDASAPLPPFALTGTRWLQPCSMDHDPNQVACHCAPVTQSIAIASTGGAHWHVAARIRGVMEKMGYTGGAMDGGWYRGGSATNGGDNIYELTISSPSAHYFINPGSNNGARSYAFDYTVAFDIDAGATATFRSDGQDGIQWMGVDGSAQPISIAGVTDPVQPYDGQWARLDVTGVMSF